MSGQREQVRVAAVRSRPPGRATASTDGERVELAWRLHREGVAQSNAGHPMRAIRLFERGLAATEGLGDDPAKKEARARLYISLARSRSEVAGLEAGLDLIELARATLGRVHAPSIRVHLHLQLGYMWMRAGQLDQAAIDFGAAVVLIDHAEPVVACNILLNRGGLALYRGDLKLARADLARCIEIASQHALPVEEFKARHNVGYLEFLSGNLAASLRQMDSAIEMRTAVSPAVALLDRSRVLLEAGLHREAEFSLRMAADLFQRDRLWQDVGEVELARAECALLDDEIPAARRLAARARDRFRRRRNDRWRRDAELVLLQSDLAAGRPGTRLAAPAMRLAGEFRSEGLATRARTARLVAAEALLSAGRLADARAVAAEAGPIRPADAMSTRLHTRLVRARIELAGPGRAAAGRQIRAGLDELTQYRAQFGSLDLQTASALHGRQLVELDLQLALDTGRAAAVLAAVERGRGISSRLPAVNAPDDPVAAELLAELRQASEELREIESDPAARQRVVRQRHRITGLQQSLRSRSWHAEGVGEAASVVAIADLGGALAEADAVLACFVASAGRLHAAVVAPNGDAQVIDLAPSDAVAELARRARADLDVLANGLMPDALREAVRASCARSLAGLDELLIRPLGQQSGELVIVPTGVLGAVPWGLLRSVRGRPVVVAPSSTAWVAATQRTPDPAVEPSIAVIAGPDLVHAVDEARQVSEAWPAAQVFDGHRASQQQLLTAMRDFSMVHVAAHGEHQAENPLFSSLRLADGAVFAYEFDRTARAPEHVVLSACELGQATIRPGDEALGLTSVLLHLGSRSVISGVARVHDEVSADVMGAYHKALASGSSSAAALAVALDSPAQPVAPFVCFGSAWTPTRGSEPVRFG